MLRFFRTPNFLEFLSCVFYLLVFNPGSDDSVCWHMWHGCVPVNCSPTSTFQGHETTKIVDGLPEVCRTGAVHEASDQFIDGDRIESKGQGGEGHRILQISVV